MKISNWYFPPTYQLDKRADLNLAQTFDSKKKSWYGADYVLKACMYFTAEDRGSSSRGNRAEGITQLENTEITDRKIYRQLRFQCWLASNFESNLYFYDMCPILYVQKSDHWWVQCKKGMSFLCSIEKAVYI